MPHRRQNNPGRSSSSRSSGPAPTSTLAGVREGIHQLFTGRSVVRFENPPPESPKPPRLQLGLQNLPSTRLVIPYISRPETRSPSPSNLPPNSPHSTERGIPLSSRPITPNSLQHSLLQAQQEQVSISAPSRQSSIRRFVGVDPAEQQLAELAHTGRQRRRHKRGRSRSSCAPKIKNRKIRSKILSCFISGLFLTLVLTIYLALALSNRDESEEFHVLLILIILVTTIFFCYALIRLCMMIVHPPPDGDSEQARLPSMFEAGGYANPPMPIRVALARDEEAAGIESEVTKYPPPAYGLWRESVRVDPNRIFWQRNEAALGRQSSVDNADGQPSTANRPPSYISENGVDYVIEAAPRSIAPTTDVPLPPHPSEVGRIGPYS